MPPPAVREFLLLLADQDDFRAAILGDAALEEVLDDAITNSCPGHVNPSLRRGRNVLHTAVALGLLNEEERGLFAALTNVRNAFAHGRLQVMTEDEAQDIRNALPIHVRPIVEPILANASPAMVLRTGFQVARILIDQNFGITSRRREEERAALDQQRRGEANRQALLAFLRQVAQEDEPV